MIYTIEVENLSQVLSLDINTAWCVYVKNLNKIFINENGQWGQSITFYASEVRINTDGVIEDFAPRRAFRAVDYGDIDGKLVVSYNHLLSQKSIAYNGTITCDLSDYLPNDGNVYEVDCSLWATSGTTNANGFNLVIISDYIGSYHGIAYNFTRTEGKSAYGSGTCKIPVGVGRYIKVINNSSKSAGTSKIAVQLHSYRKVR